jgi:glycine betaine/proline transport system substrate-binding protein
MYDAQKSFRLLVLVLCTIAIFSLFSVAQAADKKLRLVYVEWDCATASTYLAKAVLEDKLGYEVEIVAVSGPVMWMSLKTKDADAMVTAWLPITHKDMLSAVKNDVEIIGKVTDGARLGLAVPEYVSITSIKELDANAAKFNKKIIGIDSGSGIMGLTEKLLDDYDIKNMELVQGSGAIMTASLQDAIRKNEWIVVTGWSPHWMFGRWKLRYLDDPKKNLGEVEYIATAARKGLKEDHPEAYAFLSRFHYKDAGQLQAYMNWNQESSDPEANARRFMKENPDLVADWLKKEQ